MAKSSIQDESLDQAANQDSGKTQTHQAFVAEPAHSTPVAGSENTFANGRVAHHQQNNSSVDVELPPVVRLSAVAKSPVSTVPINDSNTWSDDRNHNINGTPQPDVQPEMTPWRPSVLRIAPSMGLVALAFTVLQVMASYAVLAASNGAEVSSWQFQPNVYLAILTAVSNKALAFAAVQGAVVTFWLRALRGTTLAQMHRDWAYSAWVYKAILSGRNCSLLALACICATFVAIDGPLLQRASYVRSTVPDSNLTLAVSLTPELPSYFTGWEAYAAEEYANESYVNFQTRFMPVIMDQISEAPMQAAVTGCEGKCSAVLMGPALTIDHCHSETDYVNFSAPLTDEEQQLINSGGFPKDRVFFVVAFASRNGTPETIELSVKRPDWHSPSCAGNVTTTRCYLVSAVAEYSVVIDDGIIALADTPHSPKIVAKANNTDITKKTISENDLLVDNGYATLTTLSGLAAAANYQFYTAVYKIPVSTGVTTQGANTWFTFKHSVGGTQQDGCVVYSDPTQEIMGWLNGLAFRTGVYAGLKYDDDFLKVHLDDGLQANQSVIGQQLSPVNVFRSNFHYFAGAAVAQLFTVVVILVTFWGYWRLGRNASFSPLEIAKAFDAPILQNVASNENGRRIAKMEEERRVQYGIVKKMAAPGAALSHHSHEMLVVADEGVVDEAVGQPVTMKEHYATMRARMPRLRRRGDRLSPKAESEGEAHA